MRRNTFIIRRTIAIGFITKMRVFCVKRTTWDYNTLFFHPVYYNNIRRHAAEWNHAIGAPYFHRSVSLRRAVQEYFHRSLWPRYTSRPRLYHVYISLFGSIHGNGQGPKKIVRTRFNSGLKTTEILNKLYVAGFWTSWKISNICETPKYSLYWYILFNRRPYISS